MRTSTKKRNSHRHRKNKWRRTTKRRRNNKTLKYSNNARRLKKTNRLKKTIRRHKGRGRGSGGSDISLREVEANIEDSIAFIQKKKLMNIDLKKIDARKQLTIQVYNQYFPLVFKEKSMLPFMSNTDKLYPIEGCFKAKFNHCHFWENSQFILDVSIVHFHSCYFDTLKFLSQLSNAKIYFSFSKFFININNFKDELHHLKNCAVIKFFNCKNKLIKNGEIQ